MSIIQIPDIGSTWLHHENVEYKVIQIANEYSNDFNLLPLTVIYQGSNGHIWAKTLDEFFSEMEPA
jgi:hypothetical protein